MSTPLEQLQYGFDRDSRRTWRQRATTQGWDNAYAYDSLNQVTAGNLGTLNLAHSAIAGVPSARSSWQYDETGNWHGYQTQADGAPALTQERRHDKGNRLMDVSGAAMMRTDRAGRTTQTVPGPADDWSSSYQITWDAWSRITAVASVDEEATVTPVATYAYDGLTRRITRYMAAADTTLHSYYNDLWRPVEERLDAATTAAASYLWGSRHRDDLVRRDRAVGGTTLNETRYMLMDYFSPASITDETGAVTERYQFSPFGLRTILNPDYTVRSDSECALEFAFHGQFCDAETGWYNYGYRYYLPALGRWVCKDPIMEAGGDNLYAITNNDSVNKVDLFGLLDRIDMLGDMAAQNAYRMSVASNPEKHRRIEFCGAICLCVATGSLQTVGPLPGENGHCPPIPCPDGWKKVSNYHSHPDDMPTSKDDYNLIKPGQREYVGTKSGTYVMDRGTVPAGQPKAGSPAPEGLKITPGGQTEPHPDLIHNFSDDLSIPPEIIKVYPRNY